MILVFRPMERSSTTESTVRRRCSSSVRPVFASIHGSHTQSIGLAQSRAPISSWYRATAAAYCFAVVRHSPYRSISEKAPLSRAQGPIARGSVLRPIRRRLETNKGWEMRASHAGW